MLFSLLQTLSRFHVLVVLIDSMGWSYLPFCPSSDVEGVSGMTCFEVRPPLGPPDPLRILHCDPRILIVLVSIPAPQL